MPSQPAIPTAAQVRYARVTLWQIAGACQLLRRRVDVLREEGIATGTPAPCVLSRLAAKLHGGGADGSVPASRVREVWRGERRLPKTWTFRDVSLRDSTWPEAEPSQDWTDGTPLTSGWYEVQGLPGGYVYLDAETGRWWRGYTSHPKITEVEIETPIRWRAASHLLS